MNKWMNKEGDFSVLNKLYLPLHYFLIQKFIGCFMETFYLTSGEFNDKHNQFRVRDY